MHEYISHIEVASSRQVPKYKRHREIAMNTLALANYKCEIDPEHCTFTIKNSDIGYTEPHHLIPMAYSEQFKYSLDTEVNIISLCSHCHNEIHYGKYANKLLVALHEDRKDLLKKAGIGITRENLLKIYGY